MKQAECEASRCNQATSVHKKLSARHDTWRSATSCHVRQGKLHTDALWRTRLMVRRVRMQVLYNDRMQLRAQRPHGLRNQANF